ncbi:MAG: hypothetical protein WCJ74_00035 [bacterium]
MSKGRIKYKWATIEQLRALPMIPIVTKPDITPKEFTERLHRKEHKGKVQATQYRFSCAQ